MGAVDQRLALLLQRFGRGDIRLDHHLLDQPVGVEARGHDHPVDRAVILQQDAALRHVEFQRLTAIAADRHRFVGGPERLQHRFQKRAGLVVRAAVDGGLSLLVGQFRRALHHDAVEGVGGLAAFLGKHHAHGKRRPVLALAQRAEIVGNPLG